MDAIVVKDLEKTYVAKKKRIKAVDGISFSVKEGEIFGLLGPNGAGKSTTINIIAGLLKCDAGTIRILGKDPDMDWEYVRNRMNTASAYFGLSDILSVSENLRVYGRLFDVKELEKRIDYLLALFELSHLKHKKSNQLSSGERTRLTLCKGLLNTPKVLLLDECTVGLDPDIAEKTRRAIREYQKNEKATIIFTSHYMYEVEELCDRIAFLSAGKIVKIDTATNLKKLIKNEQIEIDFVKTDPKLKAFFSQKGIDIMFVGENAVRFEVEAGSERLYKLLNSLFTRGYKVRELSIHRPTLDDIFITIARGGKR
ncbi:MAG: ABC transporter ATP-binding protein [archaeon]